MSYKNVEVYKNINLNRLGETVINNQGEVMYIIEYNNNMDITVKFKNTGELVKTCYNNFKKGNVKSHFTPSVYGVGIVGLENTRSDNGKTLLSYEYWTGMLRRCYNDKYTDKHPTYKDCKVCDEWLCYKNFKKWFDENYYEIDEENMQLDKDILHKGNKIYSPENCIFAPHRINSLFTKSNSKRGNCPIGVYFEKKEGRYKSQLKTYSKRLFLGYYNTPEEAFNAYKIAKENYIKEVADEYKDKIPNKLYEAMYNWEVEITD